MIINQATATISLLSVALVFSQASFAERYKEPEQFDPQSTLQYLGEHFRIIQYNAAINLDSCSEATWENGFVGVSDWRKELGCLTKSAEEGNPNAKSILATLYYRGQGVEKNYQKAFSWALSGARAGHATAQNYVAYMYATGQGTEQDYSEARNWYIKSAEAGNIESQGNIGYMYYAGLGGKEDYHKAVKWFRQASDNDNPMGIYGLGLAYTYGIANVEIDQERASSLFLRAAKAGNIDAQFRIALRYKQGIGVPRSETHYQQWLKEAESGNHAAARFMCSIEDRRNQPNPQP